MSMEENDGALQARGTPSSETPRPVGVPTKEPDQKPSFITPAALHSGEISALFTKDNYGFILPFTKPDEQEQEKRRVYFRFDERSNTDTGLLDIQVGDVLQYTSNIDCERPHALYARLWQCKQRSPSLLWEYLDKLLFVSQENAGKVLREITKCPAGFILVLQMRQPPPYLVHCVLKLTHTLHAEAAAFYAARLKQFYKLFCGSEFLTSSNALKEYALHSCEEEEEDQLSLIKAFILHLGGRIPEVLTDLLQLVEAVIDPIKDDERWSPYCEFLMEIIRCQADVSKLNSCSSNSLEQEQMPAWDKMPLVPLSSELGSGFTSPSVKKTESYGSMEGYVGTYYQLLREDCFDLLRKGLADLKANKLDPKDLKVWVNGSVIGVHFGRRNPGITIAVKAQRLQGGKEPAQLPIAGTLLCISDDVDGGKFDNPIWGVVAKSEEDKQSPVIFVEIVDGKPGGLSGQGVHSAQCISRLRASSNFNFVENPTFYRAYEPVLRALQQMDCQNSPFKQEFVYTEWTNKPPAYLSDPATTVDWGCLFGESTVRCGITNLDNLIQGGYQTTLDQSQLDAVKLAVNNRLVFIQGPPGTDNSFVGAKILKIILSANTLPCAPVLVVSFTNQDLDNFLQSCLKFCPDGLVRVGRRSTESSLDKFNLNSLLPKFDEFTPDCFENAKKLDEAQSELEEALKQLRLSHDFCLESVVRYMPDLQLRKLIHSQGNHTIPDLLPEEYIPLTDFLGQDSSDSKKLSQVLSKTLERWMPEKETFRLVAECFARPNVSTPLNYVATDYDTDEGVSDADEEDNGMGNVLKKLFLEAKTSEKEELDERAEQTGKGGKQNRWMWLNNDFFRFKPIAVDGDPAANAYTHIRISKDIDVERYHWLLDEDPWDLNESERAILVQLIMQVGNEKAVRKVRDAKKAYDDICQDMEEINKRRQLQVLRNAKIVGMTTTGAALNQELLKALNPCIVFVEEAAKVSEPELLAVVGPSVQHLILIGDTDDDQLSSSEEVDELERRYGFPLSLFERLVEHNKIPFQASSSESRMREEFVPMILPIYPNLLTNTHDAILQTKSGESSSGNNSRESTCRERRSDSAGTRWLAGQRLGLPATEPDQKRSQKTVTALQFGEISVLLRKENYGFMFPLRKADDQQEEKRRVYFRFDERSRTDTGLLDIQVGDVLQYTSNNDCERPRALHARLWQCKQRSPLQLRQYLDKLTIVGHENAGKVLREITRCPAGILLVLQMKQPRPYLVHCMLKLTHILHAEVAAFYTARLKQFYKLFCGSEFLASYNALKEYALRSWEGKEEDRLSLIKAFILRLAGQIPEMLTDLVPLVQVVIDPIKDDKKWSPYCEFLMEIIRCQADVSRLNSSCSNSWEQEQKPAWDKMPLVPLPSELGSRSTSLHIREAMD